MHKVYRQAAHHTAQKRSVSAECSGAQVDDSAWQPVSKEPSPDAAAALADELAAIMALLNPAARRVVELRLQGNRRPRHRRRNRLLGTNRAASSGTSTPRHSSAPGPGRRRRHSAGRVLPAPASSIERRSPYNGPKTAVSDPDAPLAFGNFVLQRQLGAGGIGKVYQTSTSRRARLLPSNTSRRPTCGMRKCRTVSARGSLGGAVRSSGIASCRCGLADAQPAATSSQ